MQSNDDIASNGIRILEMAVTYPVDTSTIKEFAHGLSELIIIEEKQPIVETAVRDILSGAANSPRIIGKSVHHADPIAPPRDARHRHDHHRYEPDSANDSVIALLPQPRSKFITLNSQLSAAHSSARAAHTTPQRWFLRGR